MLGLLRGGTSPETPAAADWIAGHCRAADGILTIRPGGHYVSGYFGNITAQGLLASGEDLGLVRDWMTWYMDHARGSGSGVDGVPDDGTERGSTFVSRGRPDSTDAYGATFLILANAAERSGNPMLRALLVERKQDVLRIASSILATLQPNGLTFSRPQHPFAYAIDNMQVYRGLLDGAALMESAYGASARAGTMRAEAAVVHGGIEHVLWDEATQSYRPVVNAQGIGAPADLTRAYPDALAQVMAIVYGIVSPTSVRASALLARASASLLVPVDGDVAEYRQLVDLAREMTGAPFPIDTTFDPPPICADAGWYLIRTH